MVDLPALTAELNALAEASVAIDWQKIYKAAQVKLAEATANGGVITWQANGRSVTRSVAELREILAVAKKEYIDSQGGMVAQLGEFA